MTQTIIAGVCAILVAVGATMYLGAISERDQELAWVSDCVNRIANTDHFPGTHKEAWGSYAPHCAGLYRLERITK